MDSGDYSVRQQLRENDLIFAQRPKEFTGESSLLCVECDDVIPEVRRAQGNRHRCVSSQEVVEHQGKQFFR